MGKMRAAVVDPNAPGHIGIREVDAPVPGPSEALVRVVATSLNSGEIRMSQTAEPGKPVGWDVAGMVEEPAKDGSGPPRGARVVGLAMTGAWAEFAAVPTNALAELPDDVSFTQAATLPVAGLTALHSVAKGGDLVQKKVLVTGASGGVGHLACQLAKLAGAGVVGLVRRESEIDLVKGLGVNQVIASEDGSAAEELGPYSLIVDGVGGQLLSRVVGMLARGGTCVAYGQASSTDLAFNLWSLVSPGRTSLYGMRIWTELEMDPASNGLVRLSQLVSEKRLRLHISQEAPFERIGEMARALIDRKIRGKAVIHIS